jgi:hypothetical protein
MLVKETPTTFRGEHAVAVEVSQRVERRRRRRIVTWAIFGVVGLGLGAVWAAGVVTTDAEIGTPTNSAPFLVTPGAAADPRFESAVTVETDLPLVIGASGSKGTIATDAQLFTVDLSGLDPAKTNPTGNFTGTYFATVEVSNDVSNTGWSQLSLEFSAAVGACSGTAGTPALDTAPIKATINVETADSKVDLTGLSGGTVYCIGVYGLGTASDSAGTFIRKTSGSANPTAPTFAIFMNQSAT